MSQNKEPEKIVPYDSAEAASIQTVTGWVSRSGRFWGNDEHMARYDGCTHRKCDACETMIPVRGYTICDQCRETKEIEKWQAMPRQEWDGKSLLYSQAADVFFQDSDDLSCHCEENECTPQSLRLVICDPQYARQIDAEDHYSDELPEDGDLPPELEEAFERLNEAIKACRTPLSWIPGKFAPTDQSVTID